MKRLQYDRYGGPEVMRLAEFTPAPPAPDEVLVRVRAAASNALDWKMRNGEMKLMTGRSFPRGMGHDFAGVVEAVGARVTRLKAGDAVFGAARFRQAGAFADVVTAREQAVVRKPADLSYEQAAALPTVGVNPATAHRPYGPVGRGDCRPDGAGARSGTEGRQTRHHHGRELNPVSRRRPGRIASATGTRPAAYGSGPVICRRRGGTRR